VRLDLANLFRHNNEHIVVIPNLIYAANYLATSGSNTGLIIYSLAVGIACTGLLLALARETLRDTPCRLMLCALLFPLVMFSAKLTHSYFLGMSGTIWLTADLFVITSAAALARAIATESAAWLLVFAVRRRAWRARLQHRHLHAHRARALLRGQAVAAQTAWSSLTAPASRHARGRSARAWLGPCLSQCAAGQTRFCLRLAQARRVCPDLSRQRGATGPLRLVAGLVIVGAGIASIWRLAAERRVTDTLLWVILFFFAPFNALMTGIGRLGYGVKIAATSRYQSVTAITLIATIVLVLAALPTGAVSRRAARLQAIAFGALLVCAVLIAIDRSYVANYAARNERKVVAETAMRQGIEGNQHLKTVTPAFGQLDRALPVLRAAKHAPFHWRSRCEGMLGQTIAAPAGPAVGRIKSSSSYKVSHGDGRALDFLASPNETASRRNASSWSTAPAPQSAPGPLWFLAGRASRHRQRQCLFAHLPSFLARMSSRRSMAARSSAKTLRPANAGSPALAVARPSTNI